jgi:hypothetical protein
MAEESLVDGLLAQSNARRLLTGWVDRLHHDGWSCCQPVPMADCQRHGLVGTAHPH